MIEFTNKAPHHANGTKWDAKYDGRKVGTLTISEYETESGEPRYQAELYNTNDTLISRGDRTDSMPDLDDLAAWAGHVINLEKPDVICADVEDPDGHKHRIVWRKVEITGYDSALENVGVRSYIWDSPSDAPILWKFVNDEKGGWWYARPTVESPRGDIAWPVESREVERGEILEPGDFYQWEDLDAWRYR